LHLRQRSEVVVVGAHDIRPRLALVLADLELIDRKHRVADLERKVVCARALFVLELERAAELGARDKVPRDIEDALGGKVLVDLDGVVCLEIEVVVYTLRALHDFGWSVSNAVGGSKYRKTDLVVDHGSDATSRAGDVDASTASSSTKPLLTAECDTIDVRMGVVAEHAGSAGPITTIGLK
jgi:hypothetical protein